MLGLDKLQEVIYEIADKTANLIHRLVGEKLRMFEPQHKLAYSAKETAKILDISEDTLQRLRKDKLISCTEHASTVIRPDGKKFNCKYVFQPKDITEYLDRNRIVYNPNHAKKFNKEQNLVAVNFEFGESVN